jgi:prevent-host-death family protein
VLKTTAQLHPLDLPTGQTYGQIMLISATEFKATCLELMDRVQQTGEEITITKHGKPLAKLAPIEPAHRAPGELFGCAKTRLTILGDIVAPVEELVWNADEENVLRP